MQEEAAARAGDRITVEAHHVGQSERVGEIVEVLGEPGHEHYLVRWQDGSETIYYPSNDALIQHA